jgi:hypothetical protein
MYAYWCLKSYVRVCTDVCMHALYVQHRTCSLWSEILPRFVRVLTYTSLSYSCKFPIKAQSYTYLCVCLYIHTVASYFRAPVPYLINWVLSESVPCESRTNL